MAAGQPLLTTDVEEFLDHVLSADALLLQYLPGGVSSVKPPDGVAIDSQVRFWEQSPGKTTARQDGRNGRVVSSPVWIVAALDRQAEGENNRIYGSVGNSFADDTADPPIPPRPYLKLAQLRLYELLHARRETFGGFHWTLDCFSPYALTEDPIKEFNDVLVGWWVRMTVT